MLVEGALLLFIVRYRSRGRPREVEGPQVHGHTNLELAWTAGPVVILAIIAGFVFYKISGIEATSERRKARPRARGRDGRGAPVLLGVRLPERSDLDRHAARCPYNRKVRLEIVSDDVDHSWWVPALGGKLDAIPGKMNYLIHAADEARHLPRPVRRVLRDPARGDARPRRGAAGRRVRRLACEAASATARRSARRRSTASARSATGSRARATSGRTSRRAPLPERPRALSRADPRGRRGKMPAVGEDWTTRSRSPR